MKLYIPILILLLIAACSKTKKEAPELSHYKVILNVDSSSAVSSYNLYRNDKLISQNAALSSSSTRFSFIDDVENTQHVSYQIEPIYYDSTGTVFSFTAELKDNNNKLYDTQEGTINFGQVVTLNSK